MLLTGGSVRKGSAMCTRSSGRALLGLPGAAEGPLPYTGKGEEADCCATGNGLLCWVLDCCGCGGGG